jgi:hypothetical protein
MFFPWNELSLFRSISLKMLTDVLYKTGREKKEKQIKNEMDGW